MEAPLNPGSMASPMHQRWRGAIITADLIHYVQRWLKRRLGAESALIIERVGERNRILLKVEREGCIYLGEVARLNGLRKTCPQAPVEQIYALFCESP